VLIIVIVIHLSIIAILLSEIKQKRVLLKILQSFQAVIQDIEVSLTTFKALITATTFKALITATTKIRRAGHDSLSITVISLGKLKVEWEVRCFRGKMSLCPRAKDRLEIDIATYRRYV
jgi:hypothetical protein